MAYVIAEPCVGTCKQACVEVCPVDAIHGPADEARRLQLYIDPDECICCGACAPECPVEAIFEEEDLPPAFEAYREINARYFRDREVSE
jgi:NAD-dependent dihydropyrimidine dehydrogenase PreA subunit